MGTSFVAMVEAPVHDNVEQAIVVACELETRLAMRPLRNTEQVLINAGVEHILAKERELGSSIRFEDVLDEVAGVYPRVMHEGGIDARAWNCGTVAGLIHEMPTVSEPMDRITAQAVEILHGCIASMLTVPAAHSPRAAMA